MPHRLANGVDQSAIDTCHMCHVAIRPTPVGTSPGVVGTHPPTHHPPPTHEFPGRFGKFQVFLGSFPGVREVPGRFGKVPRCFRKFPGCFGKFPERWGKFRVFLGRSPGVSGSSGTFWEVPRVSWEVPGVLGNSPRRHECFALPKAKLSISRMFHSEPAVTPAKCRKDSKLFEKPTF